VVHPNSDGLLPLFYIIRNCIVITCALDNLDERNIWRLSGEQAYSTFLKQTRRKEDGNYIAMLANLRKGLDEVRRFVMEDMV
jgi:hypothetical protein